jgi:hypothetical protein
MKVSRFTNSFAKCRGGFGLDTKRRARSPIQGTKQALPRLGTTNALSLAAEGTTP